MQEAVLITGSSSGIGMETALFLAKRGFRVYASMRDTSRSKPLRDAARERDVSLSILSLDLTENKTIQQAIEQIRCESGGLFALINNAGIQVRGFFEDIAEEEMRTVFETNLFGTFAVTRAVLPLMRKARKGRILFMGSLGGRIATMGSSAYCITKFALEGFAEALYQEMLPLGIHVSIVEPGVVRTDLFGRNRTFAKRALDPGSPYARWLRSLESLTDEWVASRTLQPSAVARVVCRALESKRPRLRYVLGPMAKSLVLGKRYLPMDFMDRLYAKGLWQKVESQGLAEKNDRGIPNG